MKTKLILALLLTLLTCSCAQLTPRQRYMVASDVFIGTNESIILLRWTGKLNDAQTEDAIVFSEFGRENLRVWKDALKAGDDAPSAIELFYINLGKLLELKKEADNEP